MFRMALMHNVMGYQFTVEVKALTANTALMFLFLMGIFTSQERDWIVKCFVTDPTVGNPMFSLLMFS